MAIFFDVYNDEKEFVLVIKDMETGEFFPSIITEVSDSVAFDHFNNFYFIRKSELERPHRVFIYNL